VRYFGPQESGSGEPNYHFEAILNQLEPGTPYSYSVIMDGARVTSDSLGFQTAGSKPFEFLAFGDSGTGSEEQRAIAQRLLQHRAEFILHTGDLVYPAGTYERYDTLYFAYYKDLMRDAPFFPCPGNHDYYETGCIPYRALHAVPEETVALPDHGRYYSFDWGNAHFISLDTNDALEEAAAGKGDMLRWLDHDLASTTKYWRIVLMHHPAYSAGIHAYEIESERVRAWIAPILDKYSVPLVLNGHEHSYQRSFPMRGGAVASPGQGTLYVTTGGGGAELHPVFPSDWIERGTSDFHYVCVGVNGGRLEMKARLRDGSEIDSFALTPPPMLRPGGLVDAAAFGEKVATGGLVSIFGYQLAPDDFVPSQYPLPRASGGTSVLLDNVPLPLLSVSGTQINAQIPWEMSGSHTLTVKTANGSAAIPVFVHPVAPAVFADAAFHQDGERVSPSAPAQAGEVVSLYLTGLGLAAGPARSGDPSPALRVNAPVHVELNGHSIDCLAAALAPGMVGVNVVTFIIPPGLQGLLTLTVVANSDRRSNSITIPVA
jgi:uncharacterized protein (TIGR03437 family)